MRFLFIFFVALVGAWRWRTWREAVHGKRHADVKATPKTTDTVVCHQCGLHIPAEDAVAGTLGVYCSAAHRLTMER